MEHPWPVGLQVALYAASAAIVVLAFLVLRLSWRIGRQLDRLVAVVEHFETELTPLARESRAVVHRLDELSAGAQRVADAAGGLLLPPVLIANQAVRLLSTGVGAFLRTLWSGRTS